MGKNKMKKDDSYWDFLGMFTSLELILLIVATVVMFGVLFSFLSIL
jgi:hypothetical protein